MKTKTMVRTAKRQLKEFKKANKLPRRPKKLGDERKAEKGRGSLDAY